MNGVAIARTELSDWHDEQRERLFAARLSLAIVLEKEMKMNVKELYHRGRVTAEELLPDRRAELVRDIEALSVAEDTLAIVKARAEIAIAEAAGGEKALGSNAEARKRSLIVGLDDDGSYQCAVDTARTLRRKMRESEMLVKNERDQLSLIKAALYANSAIGE